MPRVCFKYLSDMFIRKKKNRSGSISVQLLQKVNGRNKLIKTIGSAIESSEIALLVAKANQEMEAVSKQRSIFVSEQDAAIESFISGLSNCQVRTSGPELVVGKIYDYIGYNTIDKNLFRHLVIARLAYPLSKLKTIEYLYRFQGVMLGIDSVYRFLDKLNNDLKEQVELISFTHTKRVLNNSLGIVFYDMTTLYFEASDEDDLRKTGFSKDGKHSNPQIFLGLLVGIGGYAIGYEIFEGNIYEGRTLIPVIERMSQKFDLGKPVIVADAGLLSIDNIRALEQEGYEYILGARIKNESKVIVEQIEAANLKNGECVTIKKAGGRLIVHYSESRARKDAHNRERGLKKLEKQITSGKLSKAQINNRGYNKYLKMEGDVTITIDKDKYNNDKKWDGLKGYFTNCKLAPQTIIDNYKNLWHVEKAFRMSKTDLRIRPIYHRLRSRIEAHICISFVAYTIYKDLERALMHEAFPLSVEKALELTHNIYHVEIMLPDSKEIRNIPLKMDKLQTELIEIINKNYPG